MFGKVLCMPNKVNLSILFLTYLFSSVITPLVAKLDEDDVMRLRGKVRQAYHTKHYKEVASLSKKLLKEYPNNLEFAIVNAKARIQQMRTKTWLLNAKQLTKLKRYNHAIRAIDTAEKIDPMGASYSTQRRKIKFAKVFNFSFRRLDSQQKDTITSLLVLAKNNLNTGNNRDALQYYAKILHIVPEYTEAVEGHAIAKSRLLAGEVGKKIKILFKTGQTLEAQKKYFAAFTKYNAILKIDSSHLRALDRKIEMEKLVEQEKEIAEKKLIVEQYKQTGFKYQKTKQFDQAIEQFQLGQQILPDYTNWNQHIKVTQRLDKLEILKKQAISRKKLNKNYNEGLAYTATENFKLAVASFQEVVSLSKELKLPIMEKLATDLLIRARKALQIQGEEQVSVYSPYYPLIQSLFSLILRHMQLAQYEAGGKHLQTIIELFPYNKLANQYITLCEIKLNKELETEIVNNFLESTKKALKAKNLVLARRKYEILKFIAPNKPKVKELEQYFLQKNLFTSKSSKKEIQALWKKTLDAQQANKPPQKVIQLAQELLRLKPNHNGARTLLLRLEKKPLKSFTRNINRIPPNATKAYASGILYYNRGVLPRAIQSFKTALQLYPQYTKANVALKKCKRYLNQ